MFLQSGRLAQADYLYQDVLKKNPDDAQAWYLRGLIAHETKKSSAAVAYLGESLRRMPNNARTHHALAAVYMAAGDLNAAVAHYGQVIEITPSDASAHYNRALALQLNHEHDAAVDGFKNALKFNPKSVDANYGLGISLHHLARYDEALEAYEIVMELAPEHANTYNAAGFTLAAMGVYQAAIDLYDRALKINPLMEPAFVNKGLALYALARYGEVLDCFQRVLVFNPNQSTAHYYIGNALNEMKRHGEALEWYDRTIELGHQTPDVYLNKAIALGFHGDLEASVQAARVSLDFKPDYAEAHDVLSRVYRQLKQYDLAVQCADRALQLQPGFASAFKNRGLALQAMGHYQLALESFDQALLGDVDDVDAHFNRGQVLDLLGRREEAADAYSLVLRRDPQYPYALGYRMHTRLRVCQWASYTKESEALRTSVLQGLAVDAPFAFLSVGRTAAELLACARQFANDQFPTKPPLWNKQMYTHSRIRVGYVSADFGEHAASYLMAGMFEQHDRQQFEVYAFSLRPPQDSPMGRRLNAAFDHFIDISHMGDLEAARLMKKLEIDIAVDLMGYTQGNRTALFTHRPAPVQVNYLGYPGSMGHACMDYILADEVLIPPESRIHYSESVVNLPGSFQANDDRRVVATSPLLRTDHGLPEDGMVFCSFNGSHKLNPDFFAVWMRLLRAHPASVLWLTEASADAMRNLRHEAAQQGVDASRLVFAPKLPYAQHLARISLADLFLDSLPFGAGATASDVLFAGVPLLTCTGEAYAGRMALSLLHHMDMSETLVAANLDAYEGMAREFAAAPEKLQAVRRQLDIARIQSPVFNTANFTRGLEQAYQAIHARVLADLPAVGFSVKNG